MKVEEHPDKWYLEPENKVDHDFLCEWFPDMKNAWSIMLPRKNDK